MKTSNAIEELIKKWRKEAAMLRDIADYPSCNPIERVAYRGSASRIDRMIQELEAIAKDT